MTKTFYTRTDIEDLAREGVTRLVVSDDVVLTLAARDAAKDLGLRLLEEPPIDEPHGESYRAPLKFPAVQTRARELPGIWESVALPPGVNLARMRRARLQRIRDELARQDCLACILFDPQNIRYATDARNMTVFMLRNPARYVVIPVQGPVVLYEFPGCFHLAEGLETIDEVRPAITVSFVASGPRLEENARRWASEMGDQLRSYGSGSRRIGLERHNTAAAEALRSQGFEIIDAQDAVERARSIKTPDELACIQWSLRVVETAVHRMREALRPGMTENQLWSVLHQSIIEKDAEYVETRLLTSGPRTNPWFQETGSRPIEASDLVALDTDVVGPFGYYADFSRTFFCGTSRPTAEQRTLYELAYEQVQTNLALIKPGMTFRELAERAWPIPEKYAQNRYFVLAHGVGMTGEYPYILHRQDFEASGYDGRIQENMTLCIESYIGEEGGNEGVKLEEQVVVTSDGARLMSQFPFEDGLLGS